MADAGLPIFDMMMDQDVLKENMFSFYMAMNGEDQSELLFGGYDTSKFTGEIQWHDVID
jgi:Eukaryotic aspartyl protease